MEFGWDREQLFSDGFKEIQRRRNDSIRHFFDAFVKVVRCEESLQNGAEYLF